MLGRSCSNEKSTEDIGQPPNSLMVSDERPFKYVKRTEPYPTSAPVIPCKWQDWNRDNEERNSLWEMQKLKAWEAFEFLRKLQEFEENENWNALREVRELEEQEDLDFLREVRELEEARSSPCQAGLSPLHDPPGLVHLDTRQLNLPQEDWSWADLYESCDDNEELKSLREVLELEEARSSPCQAGLGLVHNTSRPAPQISSSELPGPSTETVMRSYFENVLCHLAEKERRDLHRLHGTVSITPHREPSTEKPLRWSSGR